MDIKERNGIIGIVTFFIGLIIIISITPYLIFQILWHNQHSSHQNMFTNPMNYLFFDLGFLAFTLFLYTYFIIIPIKTLKGKKILTIVTMIFGGVLVVIPLIGIGFLLPDFLDYYLDSFFIYFLMGLIPLLVLLIPGIILFIHGWYMRKNLRIENNS
jgi:hypothetical protein